MKEADIQRAILDYLAFKKYVAFKVPSGGIKIENRFIRMAKAGTSDIIGCSPTGRFIAIEVKKKSNKPTPAQLEFLDEVHRNNGIGIVAYSLDEVMRLL